MQLLKFCVRGKELLRVKLLFWIFLRWSSSLRQSSFEVQQFSSKDRNCDRQNKAKNNKKKKKKDQQHGREGVCSLLLLCVLFSFVVLFIVGVLCLLNPCNCKIISENWWELPWLRREWGGAGPAADLPQAADQQLLGHAPVPQPSQTLHTTHVEVPVCPVWWYPLCERG